MEFLMIFDLREGMIGGNLVIQNNAILFVIVYEGFFISYGLHLAIPNNRYSKKISHSYLPARIILGI